MAQKGASRDGPANGIRRLPAGEGTRQPRLHLLMVGGATSGLIVAGMWVQAAALLLTALTREFGWWLGASLLLGLGTAMVYPSLIAAVSDASHPSWRARSLSVYRFWRDLGYAIGALSAGLIADFFGFPCAIGSIAALTFASGTVVALLMRDPAAVTANPVSNPSPENHMP